MADDVASAIAGAAPASDPLTLAKLPVTDLGMAERYRMRFGDRVARTAEAGWVAFDEARGFWQMDARGEALARIYAHKTANLMWEEIGAVKEKLEACKKDDVSPDKAGLWLGLDDQLLKAMDRACDASGTNAMLAQVAPYLTAALSDFDPDPTLVCTPGGTLRPAFKGEPCIVVRDVGGKVTGVARADGFDTEDEPTKLGIWNVSKLPGRMWKIGDDVISDADLKLGYDLGQGGSIKHCLYLFDVTQAPHNPRDRITRQTAVAWNEGAKCPQWRAHLEQVLPNPADRDFFQRAMGYGMLGSNAAQCFLLIQGKGADGKTTTMNVIRRTMGTYFRACDPRTWLETKNRSAADASPDMARLAGDTRLVYCEEPPKGVKLNEALLKQATGGMEMNARELNKGLFDFTPRFLLVMAFNDLPSVSGGDNGFWRRVRLIRFPRSFTEEEQQAAGDVEARLLKEAPGILNWLLEGLALYHANGLKPHESMRADIEEFRATSDPFGEWWRDRVVADAKARVLNSDLYKDYKEYVEREGGDGRGLLGPKAFANRLSSLQIPLKKTDGGMRYRMGVKLAPMEDWMTAPKKRERASSADGYEERE